VTIALCGLTTLDGERWAVAAVAGHPGGEVRTAILRSVTADRAGFGVRATDADGGNGGDPARVLAGDEERLEARLGPDAELSARVEHPRRFPRRALGSSGLAQVVPALPQYWQPLVMGGRVSGELRLGSETVALDGGTAYIEKNWGSSFPERWWWGQADDFAGDACVAFAGGPIRAGGLEIAPTLVTVRLGDRYLSFSPPLARSRASVGEQGWRIEVRSPRHSVALEGDDPGASAVALPVPRADAVATDPRSHQALAGRLRMVVRRGWRILFAGESQLAGLERHREGWEAASA
jgi:hypothetical protein